MRALILTTRYGRAKTAGAKAAVGTLFALELFGMMAAVCRTGFAAILISLAVIYVPMASSQYLPLGIQKLLDLIPLVGSPADIFRTNVYHIFGKIVWSPYLLITVPFLLGIVCIPICIRKWAGPGNMKCNGTACSRTEDGL